MRGKSYLQLRETTFDLYTEQERLPWYFKFLSTFSAWLVLAGYITFSIAYTSTPDELRVPQALVVGVAASAVFLGYLSDAALAFISRSLIFTFDGVLMPVLTASAVGVFSTVVHTALKRETPPENYVYLWVPLVVSAVATAISSGLSWVVYRKLRKIKDLDARRRTHIPMDNYSSPMIPKTSMHISREVQDMVPDDEKQRRQLMHLLMAKDAPHNASLEDSASSTYRIDLPWEESAPGSRQRSGSVPSQRSGPRFAIAGLGIGRERSTTGESFKDPRERRREQIERSGLAQTQSQSSTAGLSPAWHGYGHSPPLPQQYQPSPQQQPPQQQYFPRYD